MNKRAILFVLLILTLTISACGGQSTLAKNRDKWTAQGISHYRFNLTISCFCPFFEVNPVTVEVLDGRIVSMTGADGQPLPENFRSEFDRAGTVDLLFAIAENSLANADQAEVTYDAVYGFPSSIIVDWIELAMDDEISYYVENFEVLK